MKKIYCFWYSLGQFIEFITKMKWVFKCLRARAVIRKLFVVFFKTHIWKEFLNSTLFENKLVFHLNFGFFFKQVYKVLAFFKYVQFYKNKQVFRKKKNIFLHSNEHEQSLIKKMYFYFRNYNFFEFLRSIQKDHSFAYTQGLKNNNFHYLSILSSWKFEFQILFKGKFAYITVMLFT